MGVGLAIDQEHLKEKPLGIGILGLATNLHKHDPVSPSQFGGPWKYLQFSLPFLKRKLHLFKTFIQEDQKIDQHFNDQFPVLGQQVTLNS